MKRFIVPFAVASLMIVSCAKENTGIEDQNIFGRVLSIDATVSEPITKGTYSGATGGKGSFSWAAGDKIGVILFKGTGYTGGEYNDWVAPFTYNTTTGKFDYSGDPVLPAGIHYGKVAFYPYGVGLDNIYDETNYNISNGNLYVHLHKGRIYDSNVQPIPVVATFDEKTEDPNPVELQHIAAGVQITLTNVPSTVTKVTLTEVSDTPQYITGWFTFPVSNLGTSGISSPANDSERGSEATYNLTSPGSTVTLTFPVPPLTTPKFKVDVYEGSTKIYSKTSKAQASLSKGQILVMPSLPVTKTITVGIITYLTDPNDGNLTPTNFKLHYWGGAKGTVDVSLYSNNTTEQKAVGASYWGNAKQTFNMYSASIPNDITGFKVWYDIPDNDTDRWFGDDASSTTTKAYIFNYSGDKALYE